MKRRFPFIPFLLVLASLIQLGYVSSHVVSPDQIIRPLAVLWLFVALILQADHGSGLRKDLDSLEKTCIREWFSAFVTCYLPDAAHDVIPADISSVTLFRIIFNENFDAQSPILENKQYSHKRTETYCDFEDVTGSLGEACVLPRE